MVACQEDDAASDTKPTHATKGGGGSDAVNVTGGAGTSTSKPDGVTPAESLEPGLHREPGKMVFRTESFTLEAGAEHYVCWAVKVPEDFKVSEYVYPGRPSVHHFLFYAVAAGNEPEGFQDCEEQDFKLSWSPLFGSGAGRSTLTFPNGVAQDVKAGSQLLVSLHLVNTTDKAITETAEVVMNRSEASDTIPVQMGVMGGNDLNLLPNQTTDVVSERTIRNDTRLVGLWAHMHMLGTALKLEVGPTKDTLSVFYERKPYDFHNQSVDSMDMLVPQGSYARLTCSYFNNTDKTVKYGESSFDEMCFLLMFSAGKTVGGSFSGF